jgi:short-subunit dehydrogenase involved in D-alanine esterification of teichoic acids
MVSTKPNTKKLFKRYMNEADIDSFSELSRQSGIDYQTLNVRIKNPGTFRVYEIRQLDELLQFSEEDLLLLMRG